jgi:pimeloyl-ACP methyl ester carboxylesterase
MTGGGGSGFTVECGGSIDGRPVLLLHGFPQDSRCWDLVVDGLVGIGCRWARFDQRGYDPARRPADVSGYAIANLVDDALAVLDGLGWDTAIVVGHDWGAIVAWALAAAHPDRVKGLVAVSVPHPTAFGRALATDTDQQARSAYIGLFQQADVAERVLLADDAKALRAIYAGIPDSLASHYLHRFRDPATLTAALAWYRAMDIRALGSVGPVSVPTRFVWGADDVAIGRTAAEACSSCVTSPGSSADPNAAPSPAPGAAPVQEATHYEFIELAGVGHWVPETAPAAVVAAVASLPS